MNLFIFFEQFESVFNSTLLQEITNNARQHVFNYWWAAVAERIGLVRNIEPNLLLHDAERCQKWTQTVTFRCFCIYRIWQLRFIISFDEFM